MRAAKLEKLAGSRAGTPWAMHLQAIALEEPARLLRNLTGAIVSCGGWVLSRSSTDTGIVTLLFEFERPACIDMYSGLVAAGLELNRTGHLRLTELCQCTRSARMDCRSEIASIELEIQTYPLERASEAHASPAT
jgi:hypothetical protein